MTTYTMLSYNKFRLLNIIMETVFYRYNPWWNNSLILPDIIPRKNLVERLKVDLGTKDILFLTGLRRIGKTTLMKLLIESLINGKKVPHKNIFYISLDDYQLSKLSILEIIEEYRRIQQIPFREKIYVFLDEVTSKDDFEIQLKNIYDSGYIKVIASSSSTTLLKSKKPYLTGRNKLVEILPLDFEEYLQFKEITILPEDRALKQKYFEEYLSIGGIPEYVLRGDVEYLKEVIDDILYKDIISHYKVEDINILKDYFSLLMERAGKVVSTNKISKILEISPDTSNRYLKMFEDSYLIYKVSRFGKTNETIRAAKKIYAADTGIKTFSTGFRDLGSLFENYVYLQIRDKKPRYVYKDGNEIDFMTQDKILIEVKYGREIEGKQKELFDKYKSKDKIVIRNIFELEDFLNKINVFKINKTESNR